MSRGRISSSSPPEQVYMLEMDGGYRIYSNVAPAKGIVTQSKNSYWLKDRAVNAKIWVAKTTWEEYNA